MKTSFDKKQLRKVLANLAKDDPKTKEVVLNGFALGNEHQKLAQLAMSLVGNTHIQVLYLNNCGITSKGAHLLAYALGKNKSLEHVWLNNNKIGSSGSEAIASALVENQTLLTVALSNNSIGNHGGKALVRAMRQNDLITDLFVEGNRMSHKIEDELNRICSNEANDFGNGEILGYPINHYDCIPVDFDAGTVGESVISMTCATLESIQEVEYECENDDNEVDDISLAPSSLADDEPMDLDFACFYQNKKKKKGKLSKLKKITKRMKRKKVEPGLQ